MKLIAATFFLYTLKKKRKSDFQRIGYYEIVSIGITEVQSVTEIPDYGVSNAILNDPFGYLWMLHQIHKEVSLEERTRLWEEKKS